MGWSPATTVGYAMVVGDSSEAIAQLIRADGIDVPIDLMGHTHLGRPGVLALRPAPLQLHYLGYPGSLGADWIDGVIADAWWKSACAPVQTRRAWSHGGDRPRCRPAAAHLPGDTFASRMGASLCAAAGLEELICSTPEAYRRRAISLGHQPAELQRLRRHLLEQKGSLPLFDSAAWVGHLECLLQRLLISEVAADPTDDQHLV